LEPSDEQLMLAIQRDKLDKLKILFDRYQHRVFSYCLKSTQNREDSSDLTQSVFVRVMKYRKSYNGNRFETWLFQIARNLVKDHFRKLKIHNDQFNPVDILPDYAEEENPNFENEQKLHVALSRLSNDKRELLVMSKFQGLKYEQIAKIRESTVSAIKVQVHRTIKELRILYFEIDEEY